MKEKSKMTTCKHCGKEIAKKAKVCPHCGGKNKPAIYKRKWFIALIVLVVLAVVVSVTSGGSDDTVDKSNITYTQYSANQMMKDLNDNALNAEKTYNDQYVEITGKLSNIDSSGDYIDIKNTDGEIYMIADITCYITDESQLDEVSKFKTGDTIKVKGKITDVGEVLGYYLDIDEISAAK
jgi:RNA polymerase subunit RPABC4/transcription elongation factor Spt4